MEFKQAIKLYLTAKAYSDTDFAEKYNNKNKSIEECVLFIQSKMWDKVKDKKNSKAACVVPTDEEVFSLAVQYYTDEDIKITGDCFNNAKCVSISATTFTDEEKAKMRQDAIKEYHDSVIAEQKKKAEERKKKPKAPVLVPDATEKDIEPKKETKELSLF